MKREGCRRRVFKLLRDESLKIDDFLFFSTPERLTVMYANLTNLIKSEMLLRRRLTSVRSLFGLCDGILLTFGCVTLFGSF